MKIDGEKDIFLFLYFYHSTFSANKATSMVSKQNRKVLKSR